MFLHARNMTFWRIFNSIFLLVALFEVWMWQSCLPTFCVVWGITSIACTASLWLSLLSCLLKLTVPSFQLVKQLDIRKQWVFVFCPQLNLLIYCFTSITVGSILYLIVMQPLIFIKPFTLKWAMGYFGFAKHSWRKTETSRLMRPFNYSFRLTNTLDFSPVFWTSTCHYS